MMNVTSGNISVGLTMEGYLSEEIEVFNPPGTIWEEDFYLVPITSIIEGYLITIYGEKIEGGYIGLNGSNLYDSTDRFGYFELDAPYGNQTIVLDAKYVNVPYTHDISYTMIHGFIDALKNKELFSKIALYELKTGSMNLGDGNVVITETIADEQDFQVGDEIYLLKRNGNDIAHWRFNISGIASWHAGDYYPGGPTPDLLMGIYDLEQLIFSLRDDNFDFFAGTELYIRVDRDKIIDPLSRDSTDFAMMRLTSRINAISAIHYDILAKNILEEPLEEYFAWYDSYRLEMLAYSIPVIAIGLYLGMVGIDLLYGQKRRVFGILKSRGATDKQIFGSLLLEALILGIIAGGLGLILGVLVSRIFLSIIPGSRNVATDLDFFSLNISVVSILLAMIFAVFLMIFAVIKPAKRVSKASAIESIHHYTDMSLEKDYRPGLDIFLVIFAIIAYLVVAEVNISELDPAKYGVVVVVLLVILLIVSIVVYHT
jgi:hypothetical protein